MTAHLIPAGDVERVLSLKTVREPGPRGHFLAALRELGRDNGDFTVERLRGLMQVDEHFHALLLYDQIEFLRATALPTEEERDFALNIQRICLEAANGFQRYLRRRESWATDAQSRELLVRLTGLALHAIHSYVKWGCFLNEPGRTAPWRQLHALYLLADAEGFAQAPFVLHAAQPAYKPSVQSLYLRTLILDMLHNGHLSRVQLEIADGWFASWCRDYSLDHEYSSRQHLFHVDVTADAGLQIIRKDAHGDTIRYVRADALRSQIEDVQAGLRHGRLFAGFGAGGVFPVEEHVALLAIIEKLHQTVLARSENRIEERTHFEDREVDVILGIDRVIRKVREGPAAPAAAAEPSAAMFSLSDTIELSPSGLSLVPPEPTVAAAAAPSTDPEIERWKVQDLSSRGYGLVVDRGAADTVLLNGLIGLRNQETGGWIVATVVRKLANRQRGEMLIGVEVMSYKPIGVELHADQAGTRMEALYLPGQDDNGRQDALIVRTTDFSAAKVLTVHAGGHAYRIRFNRIIRKGADWIKARFEVETKS